MDVQKFVYRQQFGLNALELEQEPTDQFFTNLHIYSQIQKKREHTEKYGTS